MPVCQFADKERTVHVQGMDGNKARIFIEFHGFEVVPVEKITIPIKKKLQKVVPLKEKAIS